MDTIDVIFGSLIAVIGYFLKEIMDDHKKTRDMSDKNNIDIQVLKTDHANKHQNMVEKFDMLNTNIRELNTNIKDLKNIIDSKN